ncbi:Cyclic nucleotide-binding protein [Pseudocohnilembus persalinus]|uniref:Cyclic nucleotide-binding protein n=1 Tax=Pseudocohnilembus persalinus TaxID=266149 RepID=A0A0V0Q8F9_PSEPJ|nr:Cyclic nucleotide-binding protein [Pseudocohnilembus persalinus]|eukprot:KRW98530.1 Cyclic nucleotide-binding protein [Pseudocohnilembus persalinus]
MQKLQNNFYLSLINKYYFHYGEPFYKQKEKQQNYQQNYNEDNENDDNQEEEEKHFNNIYENKDEYLADEQFEIDDQNQFSKENQNKWIIMPESKFKVIWNYIIVFFMIYTATLLPYLVCFVEEKIMFVYWFDQVMNGVFALDIILSFFSAYYDNDNILVTSNKYIATQYLKTWFLIDFISVIPFSDILGSQNSSSSNDPSKYNSLVRLARLPRLYRLVRLFRLIRLAKFKKDGYSSENSWVHNLNKENENPFNIYVISLIWSLQTLTTVGFGNVPAITVGEKIFAIIWMGIGGAFFSFMISNLQGAADENQDTSINSKFNRLLMLQNELKIPNHLLVQIKKQMDFSNKELKHNHLAKNADFIEQLPTTLRAHVLVCVFSNIINKVPFFLGKDIELIMSVIPYLNALYRAPGDIIYKNEDQSNEVYFLYQGEVQIKEFKEGNEITTFVQGDFFGELEIIANIRRIGTAIATQKTYLFSMDQDKFMKMILEFGESNNGQVYQEIQNYYDIKRQIYQNFISEENKYISDLPFSILVQGWQEKYEALNDIQENIKNQAGEYVLSFNQNTITKNSILSQINTPQDQFLSDVDSDTETNESQDYEKLSEIKEINEEDSKIQKSVPKSKIIQIIQKEITKDKPVSNINIPDKGQIKNDLNININEKKQEQQKDEQEEDEYDEIEKQLLYFESLDDKDIFCEELAEEYQNQFNMFIDDVLQETNKLKKALKLKINYYSSKKEQMTELLDKLTDIRSQQLNQQ